LAHGALSNFKIDHLGNASLRMFAIRRELHGAQILHAGSESSSMSFYCIPIPGSVFM